jgi:hypothetical protein
VGFFRDAYWANPNRAAAAHAAAGVLLLLLLLLLGLGCQQ